MGKAIEKKGGTTQGVISGVASALVPGLGQFVNGENDKAIGVLTVWAGMGAISWLGIPIISGIAGMASVGTWIYGVADGYFRGKKE